MLLAIDTSTRYAGVALGAEGRVVSVSSWFSSVNHTVELMPAISAILQSQGLSAADLSGIAVALGPGGFSALRVGVSVAKGLAMTAGKPLVGVGTLDLEAFPYLESGLPVCALLDAGRQEVAVAHFGPDGRRDRDVVVGTPQALFEAVGVPTIVCGEGVQTRIQMIKDRLGALAVIVKAAPGARPLPFRARTLFFLLSHTRANISPPTPVETTSTTFNVAAAATAASTGFPPSINIFRPAMAARGWLVATMPFLAWTVERLESKNICEAPE